MKNRTLAGRAVVGIALMVMLSSAALAGVEELSYDSFNDATNMTYDGLGRILVKNFTTGQHNYTYDADYLGTLANVTFPNGSIAYEYDDRLRVVKETRVIDGIVFARSYDYDSADRVARHALNPGNVSRYTYTGQGLPDRIVGFINSTRHNAFGNVLNRTYASGKVTNFTYNHQNARLERISTDSIQNLVYGYDGAGNIVMINDSANARLLEMAYDELDRLVNMSVNGGQSFVYRYDAVGNLLRIMRDSASVTRLVYGGTPVHAPRRVFSGNASVEVGAVEAMNGSSRSRIVQLLLVNRRNATAAIVNWTIGFGEGNDRNGTVNSGLDANERAFVFAEHDYATGGSYKLNATAGNVDRPAGYAEQSVQFGIVMDRLELLEINITNVSYAFVVRNGLAEEVSGVSWECNNGLSGSGVTVGGLSNQTITAVYNYSAAGTKELNCSISSADGADSAVVAFEVAGISITEYNLTFTDGNTTELRFNVTNRFHGRPVDWRIASDGQEFTGTTANLPTNASAIVTQEINYTTPGKKTVEINITAGDNLSDVFTDAFTLRALEIEDYHFRNVTLTRRALDFRMKNVWTENLSAEWNLTSPSIANTSIFLDAGESLWVYVEADYSQGMQKVTTNVFNGSLRHVVVERFANRLVDIFRWNTVKEGRDSTIVEASIRSDDERNVSWSLNTGEDIVSGAGATAVNATADVVVLIERSYAASDVQNASLTANASDINDTRGGVMTT